MWLQSVPSTVLALDVLFNPFGRRLPSVGLCDSVELCTIAQLVLLDC